MDADENSCTLCNRVVCDTCIIVGGGCSRKDHGVRDTGISSELLQAEKAYYKSYGYHGDEFWEAFREGFKICQEGYRFKLCP